MRVENQHKHKIYKTYFILLSSQNTASGPSASRLDMMSLLILA